MSLPPLPEQKKIAAILSSVDEAIRATEAVIEQTRRVKEGLLQELLTRGIGPDGRPHTRFKKTEIGEIPEGWEVEKLGTLIRETIRNGYSPVCLDVPNGRWVLGLGALGPDGFVASAIKPAPIDDAAVDDYRLRPGDFLVSRSNTVERVGLSAMFRGEVENCSYPDLMMRFRVRDEVLLPTFLEQQLRSTRVRAHIQGAAAGTSGSMVKITKRVLEQLAIVLPPRHEQAGIAASLGQIDENVAAGAEQVEALRGVKSGLLQDLLTGNVRVTP